MNERSPRVLVFGYGNPGRLDDGLGPAFARRVERLALPAVTVESDYQLNVEAAAEAADFDVVVFADAALQGAEPFECRPVEGDAQGGFTSHSVQPAQVVHLARALFGACGRAYALGIRGYEFDGFGERLSARAAANLEKAVQFLVAQARRGWAFRDAAGNG